MIESNKILHYFYKYIPFVFALILVSSLTEFEIIDQFQIYFISLFCSVLILLQIVFIKKFGLAKLSGDYFIIFGKSFSWAEIKTVKRFNHIYMIRIKGSPKYFLFVTDTFGGIIKQFRDSQMEQLIDLKREKNNF